jgi:hypothetical protein
LRDTDRADVLGPDGEYRTAAATDTVDRFNAQDFLLARHTTDYAREQVIFIGLCSPAGLEPLS